MNYRILKDHAGILEWPLRDHAGSSRIMQYHAGCYCIAQDREAARRYMGGLHSPMGCTVTCGLNRHTGCYRGNMGILGKFHEVSE